MSTVPGESMATAFCNALIALAQQDSRIVQVHADLMRGHQLAPFADRFPERSFNVGIAEANMACVSAGLASEGFIPFACTFSAFASRRMFDQTALSIAYARQKVIIVGSDPGICPEINGGTHMALEDAALMRTLPNMLIADPCDTAQLCAILPLLIERPEPVFLRLFRKQAPRVTPDGAAYALGRSLRLREGKDVTIFAEGIMVQYALEAAEALTREGIQARVENLYTLRPLDEAAILAAAKETGAIVVAENHSVNGAWGSAVAEVLAETHSVPMRRIGVRGRFGEVGRMPYLLEVLGMSPAHIADAARGVLARKAR